MEVRWVKKEEIGDMLSVLREAFPVDTTCDVVYKHLDEVNRFLVAVDEGKIVGVIWIRKEENFIENLISFHLQTICVLEKYRNRGIGSQMLQKVEEIARYEKVDFIDLTSSNYREAAHHTYIKNGYEKRNSTLFRRKISTKGN